MDTSIIIAIVGAAEVITTTVVAGLFSYDTRKRNKNNAAAEKRAAVRVEESKLSMKLMSANTNLTIATAIAVRDQKVNGRMTTALAEADQALKEYHDFLNRVVSSQMTAD